jgi:hypothetical protein
MASFLEFFNRRKRSVDEMIDKTYFRLLENTAPIDALIPAENYADQSLLIAEIEGARPTLANIVANDQEIPASRQNIIVSEREFRPYFAGKRITWTSRDFDQLNRLQDMVGAGRASSAFAMAIEQSFFKRMVDLVPSVYERSLVFAMQALCGQAIDYTDPITKARFQLTYTGTIAGHLPAALTSTARWSQPTTCTPLANLQSLAETVYGTTATTGIGVWMDTLIMHWRTLRQVADSTEAKTAWLRKQGADSATPDVAGVYLSDEMTMDMIKERARVANIILFDAQYSEENEDGTTTSSEFFPADYIAFVHSQRKMIKRAFVPVIGADGRQTAGVAQVTKNNQDIPYREWTTVLGACIPAVLDARYLVARKVA